MREALEAVFWDRLAAAALLAPSADNRQVFRLRRAGLRGFEVWAAPDTAIARSDQGHRLLLDWISLGAVIENLRLAAGSLGYRLSIEAVERRAQLATAPLFRCELSGLGPAEALGVDNLLSSHIPDRQTNRSMYSRAALRPEDLHAMQKSCATGAHPASLMYLSAQQRRLALRLIWMAESERFREQRLHEELFGSIRFDLPWHVSSDRLISPGALGVEAPLRPAFAALRHWPLMRLLSWVGLHRGLGWRSGWLPCWQAPALGVICVPRTERVTEDAMACGVALQRLWLTATQLKLAMQPLAASTVFSHVPPGTSWMRLQVTRRLGQGWEQLFGPQVRAMMVVRMGHAPPLQVRSGRSGFPSAAWVDDANVSEEKANAPN